MQGEVIYAGRLVDEKPIRRRGRTNNAGGQIHQVSVNSGKDLRPAMGHDFGKSLECPCGLSYTKHRRARVPAHCDRENQ